MVGHTFMIVNNGQIEEPTPRAWVEHPVLGVPIYSDSFSNCLNTLPNVIASNVVVHLTGNFQATESVTPPTPRLLAAGSMLTIDGGMTVDGDFGNESPPALPRCSHAPWTNKPRNPYARRMRNK